MNAFDVWLHRERAGQLTRTGQRHGFTYLPDASEALSLTMPLRVETYLYEQGLHPVFQMNLPEGYLRQALERYAAKQFGSDDLTYLVLLGNDQIGRLRYSRTDAPLPDDNLPSPSLADLLSSDDAQLFQQLFDRYALHSGVAGVQPKFLMDANAEPLPTPGRQVSVPLKKYIVKSWGPEFPELACNEFACLSLARAAGLATPTFYLSDNGKLLVSERFDLDENGRPLGFEDFCVLQAKTTAQKYDASLESCANTLVQFLSPETVQQGLLDFFTLTLINIKIRNGDAHLKNLGVLYPSLPSYKLGQVPQVQRRFAPVFDLVNTTAYIPQDSMALSLTGSKRWPKWRVLEKFAKIHCRLSGKLIEQALHQVETAAAHTLPLLESLMATHPGFAPIANVIGELLIQRIDSP